MIGMEHCKWIRTCDCEQDGIISNVSEGVCCLCGKPWRLEPMTPSKPEKDLATSELKEEIEEALQSLADLSVLIARYGWLYSPNKKIDTVEILKTFGKLWQAYESRPP